MIEPPDLEATPSGEYELDAPEVVPSSPANPAPLPRMWKTEDSDPELKARPDKKGPAEKPAPSPSRGQSQPSAPRRPAGPESPLPKRDGKKPSSASVSSDSSDDPDKKKVLVEETPEWDTYETRRRARLFLGGGMISFVLLVGWVGYRMFIYDPDAVDPNADASPAQIQNTTAVPSIDVEAMAMIDRAKEHDKAGRHEAAVALLNTVVKTKAYAKTAAVRSATTALELVSQGLPMFPDRPPAPAAMANDQGVPLDGVPAVPANPARGITAAPPPAEFDQTRPPDAARGLAMVTPAKPSVPASSKPAPSVDPAKSAPVVPPKPPMNPLPRGFHAIIDEGVHESGWPFVIEGDKDEGPMVFVPEGTFVMGANGGLAAESPAHRVRLRAFYIDQHEVTIGQFTSFLDQTGYRRLLPRTWTPSDGKSSTAATMPVVMVNYKDVQAYAEWSHRQIPTEAQWEMAARSTVSNLFPWGSDTITWNKPRSFRQIDPVKSFGQDRSPFGVFDLAGNVSEWTQDWFDLKYFQIFKDTVAIDPTGPAKGSRSLQRVVKGGAKDWSVSYREGIAQEKRVGTIGFRCVLNINSNVPAPAAQPVDPNRPNLAPVIPF